LRDRLFDVDLAVVAHIACALKRIGDREAIENAVAALDDPRYSRRFAAIRALGAFADPRAAGPLRARLGDEVAGVRVATLEALAKLGRDAGPDAGADCARLLADPIGQVRVAAIRAVGRLVDRPGELLAGVVEDRERLVRLEVARYVGGLPERATQVLLGDPDLRVREAAARAAGTREIGVLAVLLSDDPAPEVRRASAHALGAMGDERLADVLVPGLEDPDALVRAAVLHALQDLLTHDGAVERLCAELTNQRAQRRRAGVYALAQLHARIAPRELSRLADDRDPDVRLALLHSADELLAEPEPVIRYLASDSDRAVSQAAEMWLLRARRR
jgi:HEAT repeat protein